MTRGRYSDAKDLDATASMWLARQDRGLKSGEEAELAAWLAVQDHAEAYARCRSVWLALPALAALRLDPPTESRPRQRPLASIYWLGGAAAAAAVLFLLISPGATRKPTATHSEQSYASAAGEELRVALPDGSVAFLNGESRMVYSATSSARRVVLQQGELHVTVAKTSSVPFLVEAGRVIVHDLGTAFDVRLTDAAVGVVVTEGKVRVLTQAGEAQPPIDLVELTAGQSALIHDAPSAAAVRVESLPAADSSQTLRWQAHHLVFERTPLAEVIRQVNRYNVRQLVMADDSLQSVELAGGIEATNLDAVVGLLESGFKIRAERRGNVILLHR